MAMQAILWWAGKGRKLWIDRCRHMQVGLEMLVSHPGNDPTDWAVTQIFYGGQLYQNTTQLNTAFADTTSGLNRQQVTFADIDLSPQTSHWHAYVSHDVWLIALLHPVTTSLMPFS